MIGYRLQSVIYVFNEMRSISAFGSPTMQYSLIEHMLSHFRTHLILHTTFYLNYSKNSFIRNKMNDADYLCISSCKKFLNTAKQIRNNHENKTITSSPFLNAIGLWPFAKYHIVSNGLKDFVDYL